MSETIPFTEEDVKAYLDTAIKNWRAKMGSTRVAYYYVDAFQSVRISLFGEFLPPTKPEAETQEQELG